MRRSAPIPCVLVALVGQASPPAAEPVGEGASVQDAPLEEEAPLDERTPGAQDRRHEATPGELPTRGWLGLRTALERRGVAVEAFLTSDWSSVLDGGVDEGASAFRYLLGVSLTLDGERLLGHDGGRLFVDLQAQDGDDGSEDVGDLQAYSNIDADGRTQVAEVWYERRVDALAGELRVGKIDANGQFAQVEHGLRFIHSSMGFSPTILGLPTYPDPSFGGTLSVGLADGASLRVGVLDGAAQEGVTTGTRGPVTLLGEPSDLFLIAQLDARWGRGEGGRPGRLGLGAWRHTGTFERFEGGAESGTDGLYATLDQLVWGAPDGEHVGAFLQLGEADEELSPLRSHLGLGVEWAGMGTGGDDAVGFGVSRAGLSRAAGADLDGAAETAWELFYSFGLGEWLRVKPDLQLVQNPGGDRALDDAWVFTLRTTLSF